MLALVGACEEGACEEASSQAEASYLDGPKHKQQYDDDKLFKLSTCQQVIARKFHIIMSSKQTNTTSKPC